MYWGGGVVGRRRGGKNIRKVNGSNTDSQGGEGDREAEKRNNNKPYTAVLSQPKWWVGGEGGGGGRSTAKIKKLLNCDYASSNCSVPPQPLHILNIRNINKTMHNVLNLTRKLKTSSTNVLHCTQLPSGKS